MKRVCLFLLLFGWLALPAQADDFRALLNEADNLYAKSWRNVTDPATAEAYLKAYHLCVRAVELRPDSYEANFKAVRAARMYCWIQKNHLVPGYQKECTNLAREGLRYGAKAVSLEPGRVESHFWYGGCLASYTDGISIVTAAKEGLKGKTQKAFETAYRIDPSYWDGCGALALGEFWMVLPWPMTDKAKSRKFLEQYLKQARPNQDNYEEGNYSLGCLLLESADPADQARGRELLKKASHGRYPYYRKVAGAALKKA